MSLEPIPLDRKSSSLRERKQGSSESLGSVARWRGSPSPSHHNRRPHEFNRSGDFRRLAGNYFEYVFVVLVVIYDFEFLNFFDFGTN